jgi:hypothetical protein
VSAHDARTYHAGRRLSIEPGTSRRRSAGRPPDNSSAEERLDRPIPGMPFASGARMDVTSSNRSGVPWITENEFKEVLDLRLQVGALRYQALKQRIWETRPRHDGHSSGAPPPSPDKSRWRELLEALRVEAQR